MSWAQYEVWGVDEDGVEDLIDTTNSLKEARALALMNIKELDNDIVECIIYREEDGELYEEEVVK
jgi:hypothetical protein